MAGPLPSNLAHGWIPAGDDYIGVIQQRRWFPPLALVAGSLAAFAAYALLGRASDREGTRVLGFFAPAVAVFNAGAGGTISWLWHHRLEVAAAVTILAAAFAFLAAARARSRALPLLLLLAAPALAVWGQVLLQRKIAPAGIGLYLAAVLCAVVAGRIFPMTRLPGFPQLPSLGDAGPAAPGLPPWEWAIVFGLTLAGLFLRGYALTENPAYFEGETLPMMLGSYTGHGIRNYLQTEFLGTGNGIFHSLTHYAFYRFLGASIFSIRLVSVFWGVLAIPLLYWLARRIAGRGAASVAGVLFVAAPEQIYWSRTDNTFFEAVAVLAIVTAHLCLSLQERFAARAALAAAAGMVACRFFYTPSWVLFTLPLLLAVHEAIFVRGAFARLRVVAPILLGGFLLWVAGVSVMEFAADEAHGWRFINPAVVRGESAWRAGVPADARPIQVLARQSARVSRNAGHVLAGMTHNTRYASHWYTRYYVDQSRQTTTTAGLVVLAALGTGYLLGQFQDRRAALLLFWIAVGLLPGCLSDEPEARRISLMFPALPIAAAVFVTASVRLARLLAGRAVARIVAVTLGIAVAATAGAGAASILLLPTEPPRFDVVRRFVEPLLSRCDLVLHNVAAVSSDVVQVGGLDGAVHRSHGQCSQFVHEKDWPRSALDPRCEFNDPVFALNLSEEEIESRRQSFHPKRVGYILTDATESRPHVALLRRLFPQAPVRELPGDEPENRLFAFELPMSEIDALRLGGVSPPAGGAESGATVEGGLLLPRKDWYRFRIEPACPGAELAAGSPPAESEHHRPHLAGVHPFSIRFHSAAGCRHPLRVRADTARRPEEPITPLLLAPRAVAAAPAVPVVAIPGYGSAGLFARLEERPADVGVDARGNVYVLTLGLAGWKVHRFKPDGKEDTVFRGPAPPRLGYASLSVDPVGNCLIRIGPALEIRDPSGAPIGSWKPPYEQPASDAAFLPDGRVVLCFPGRSSVEIFSREGRYEESLAPAGGRFATPAGVAVSPEGTVAIVEETGLARVFRNPPGRWAPQEAGRFSVAYPEAPYHPDLAGCAFDGSERILFPHRSLASPLAYDVQGRPLMASAPERDLSEKGLKEARGSCSTRETLYVLEIAPASVIRVARQ